jgi:hypothetical protein
VKPEGRFRHWSVDKVMADKRSYEQKEKENPMTMMARDLYVPGTRVQAVKTITLFNPSLSLSLSLSPPP